MGKRSLAGVAAGALGLSLIPFVGVGVASAGVTSVTQPSAVRAAVATAATGYAINGTTLGSATNDAYIFSVLSGTQFADDTDAGGSNRPNAGGTLVQPGAVTFAAGNAGLTVTVGVYKATNDGAGTCAFTALGATGVAPTATATGGGNCVVTLESTFTQGVGGAITAIAMTPASGTTVVGGTQAYVVTATDVAGIPTLTSGADTINAVSANPAVATVAFAQVGAAMTITATGVAAGSTNLTAVPTNAAVTSRTSAVTVVANGATSASTDVRLSGSNILANDDTVGARTYFVNPLVSSLNFEVSGLTAGATYRFTATGGGVTVAPTGGSLTADASGNATVAVSATTPAATNTVTFVVIDNGGAGNKQAVATYQAPALAWQSPTPANLAVLFGTASSTVTINVKVADQYGNPGTNTSVELATGGTLVETKVTNASGEATLTANVPATGSTAYTVTPGGAGAGIGVRNVTVRAGTVDLTTTSGLSTATTTVTVQSWTATPQAVVTADTTPVIMNVAQAGVGIDNVPVTITAGEGALLFAADPAGGVSYTTGETSLVVTSAGGGNVSFWATASKSGVVSVTASAGGATLTGNFTGGAPIAAAARSILIEAPAEVEAGGVAIATVTAVDNFGSVVPGAGVTVSFDAASPGLFANGTRSTDLTMGADGKAQVTVTSGINERGTMALTAGTSGVQQFGAVADRLIATDTTSTAPGYTASNAPVAFEIAIGEGEKSLAITATRVSGTVVVDGDAQGFERRDQVNLEFRKYNKKKKKWSKWKSQATVLVKKDESFGGVVSIKGKVRVRAASDGIRSNVVRVG